MSFAELSVFTPGPTCCLASEAWNRVLPGLSQHRRHSHAHTGPRRKTSAAMLTSVKNSAIPVCSFSFRLISSLFSKREDLISDTSCFAVGNELTICLLCQSRVQTLCKGQFLLPVLRLFNQLFYSKTSILNMSKTRLESHLV